MSDPITDADLADFRARIDAEDFRIADDEAWFWSTLHRVLERAQGRQPEPASVDDVEKMIDDVMRHVGVSQIAFENHDARNAQRHADLAKAYRENLLQAFRTERQGVHDIREYASGLESDRQAAIARAEKAEAFKTFVHKRLDEAGVPHDPDPAHNAQHGCRIGGRLNWLVEKAGRRLAEIRD